MRLAERVGHRYAVAKPRIKIEWASSWAVTVKLYVGRSLVGKLFFNKAKVEDEGCLADVEKLKEQGYLAEKFWCVDNVVIQEEHRNQGYGKLMYESAIKAVSDKEGAFYTGPSSCWIASVSDDAMRVWTSLKSRYPHVGSVLYVK